MAKLICDFDVFKTKNERIAQLIDEYEALCYKVTSISRMNNTSWMSESQKVFHSKFMEREAELAAHSIKIIQLKSFLEEVITTYENIENNYS